MTELKSVIHTGAKLVQNQKGSPVAVSIARPMSSTAISVSSAMEMQNHLLQEVSDPSRICIPNLHY